jgi:hypothetical protein
MAQKMFNVTEYEQTFIIEGEERSSDAMRRELNIYLRG